MENDDAKRTICQSPDIQGDEQHVTPLASDTGCERHAMAETVAGLTPVVTCQLVKLQAELLACGLLYGDLKVQEVWRAEHVEKDDGQRTICQSPDIQGDEQHVTPLASDTGCERHARSETSLTPVVSCQLLKL